MKKNFPNEDFTDIETTQETEVEDVIEVETEVAPVEYEGIVSCLLNIRKEPSGEILGTYDAGTMIHYEKTDFPDWIKTGRGYVMKEYVD